MKLVPSQEIWGSMGIDGWENLGCLKMFQEFDENCGEILFNILNVGQNLGYSKNLVNIENIESKTC